MHTDLLQYLSPSEQIILHQAERTVIDGRLVREIPTLLTSLAETRAVMAEHEWHPSSKQWADGKTHKVCIMCSGYKHQGHKSHCLFARLPHPAVEKG